MDDGPAGATEYVGTWPNADRPWWSQLSLAGTGHQLRVVAMYGLTEATPGTVAVTLDRDAVHQFADLAATIGEPLNVDDPPASTFKTARGTVQAAEGFVSAHARSLYWSPAVTVFVANRRTGNYSIHFRRAEWAEITDALARLCTEAEEAEGGRQ